MAAWIPLPEPVSWPLPTSMANGGLTYKEITLRAPTGEDLMKASAMPGASNAEVTIRLIENVSGVPYDIVKKLPWATIQQMSGYMDEFLGAPSPDPLEQWREARRLAAVAEAEAERKAAAGAATG